jgi:hypothetical protein
MVIRVECRQMMKKSLVNSEWKALVWKDSVNKARCVLDDSVFQLEVQQTVKSWHRHRGCAIRITHRGDSQCHGGRIMLCVKLSMSGWWCLHGALTMTSVTRSVFV